MRQFAAEDVGEYLRIAVRVCWEACLGSDAVFVENAETAKRHEGGVVVLSHGESVVTVEPIQVGVAAGRGLAKGNLRVRQRSGHGVDNFHEFDERRRRFGWMDVPGSCRNSVTVFGVSRSRPSKSTVNVTLIYLPTGKP